MAMIITPKPNVIVPEVDQVRHYESGVDLYNGTTLLGKGALYLTAQSLNWINPDDEKGISLRFYDIPCHAVSRDLNAFDHPCIYMMVRVNELVGSSNEELANLLSRGPDDYEEIRLVPRSEDSLQTLYDVICECQALNPDPTDNGLADTDEDDLIPMLEGEGRDARAEFRAMERVAANFGNEELVQDEVDHAPPAEEPQPQANREGPRPRQGIRPMINVAMAVNGPGVRANMIPTRRVEAGMRASRNSGGLGNPIAPLDDHFDQVDGAAARPGPEIVRVEQGVDAREDDIDQENVDQAQEAGVNVDAAIADVQGEDDDPASQQGAVGGAVGGAIGGAIGGAVGGAEADAAACAEEVGQSGESVVDAAIADDDDDDDDTASGNGQEKDTCSSGNCRPAPDDNERDDQPHRPRPRPPGRVLPLPPQAGDEAPALPPRGRGRANLDLNARGLPGLPGLPGRGVPPRNDVPQPQPGMGHGRPMNRQP